MKRLMRSQRIQAGVLAVGLAVLPAGVWAQQRGSDPANDTPQRDTGTASDTESGTQYGTEGRQGQDSNDRDARSGSGRRGETPYGTQTRPGSSGSMPGGSMGGAPGTGRPDSGDTGSGTGAER